LQELVFKQQLIQNNMAGLKKENETDLKSDNIHLSFVSALIPNPKPNTAYYDDDSNAESEI
jgi:hypothetical protein